MNQKTLIAIIILAGIGSIGSVLAYSGTISAGQGNFNNVLVTGTCTGCGGGEGSFTNYNTIALNTTVYSIGDNGFQNIQIDNNGNFISQGTANNGLVALNGTVVFVKTSNGASGTKQIDQSSITGKYKVLIDESGDGIPNVFSNNALLQTLGLNQAQFSGGTLSGAAGGTAISPDGHYILVIAKDSSGTKDRVIIFQGS